MILHLDYETRSIADLTRVGAYKYAAHPTTEILCLGWAINDGPVHIWDLAPPGPRGTRQFVPLALAQALERALTEPATLWAHNAQFERLITQYVLGRQVPALAPLVAKLPISAWYCTAAQARVSGLPGKLDLLAKALKLPQQKDPRGVALIRRWSTPREDCAFHDPIVPRGEATGFSEEVVASYREMQEYCSQDVRVERLAAKASRAMTQAEHADWVLAERINDTGLMIDREWCAHAAGYARREVADLNAQLKTITGGAVGTVRQFAKALKYIKSWLTPVQLELMRRTDKKGTERLALDTRARADLLDCADLDPRARDVLDLLDAGGNTSVSKYQALLDRASDDDDRVRGAYLYAGAPSTLRFSSQGAQLHNFKRTVPEDADTLIENALAGGSLPAPVMGTLASLLRPSIVAPADSVLVWGDYAAIEARALPWLADARRPLEAFYAFDAGSGPDVYKLAAADIFGVAVDAVTADQRQIGKVACLSLGYGGAQGAFRAMARNYGVDVEPARAREIALAWRGVNLWAVDFWAHLQQCATDAVAQPGSVHSVPGGRVAYSYFPEYLGGALVCRLPLNVVLTYPFCRRTVNEKHGTWELSALKASRRPEAGAVEWPRVRLWGGLLAENVTQAVCAALLRLAQARIAEETPYLKTIGHTHDEVLCEAPVERAEAAVADLHAVMTYRYAELAGWPIAAKCGWGFSYLKR